MLIEKAIKRLKQVQEMDLREFRRQMSFVRLDKKDIDAMMKDLAKKGIIEIEHSPVFRQTKIRIKKKLK